MRKLPWPVVLASASPRRQELLRRLIDEYEVLPADVPEHEMVHEDPWVTAQQTAREKALAVFALRPNALVLGGDTVVAFQEDGGEWTQLAKPEDEEDAFRMLRLLAGRTHTVVTGVCLRWPGGMTAFTDATKVTFRNVPDAEIRAYIATREPMDKAGAYGLQGGAKLFVEKMEGSPTNVIGLPIEKLEDALKTLRK